MPTPTLITDLSTTAASNFPAGSDSPSSLDDVQRAHAAFIAQIRDGAHVPSAAAKTTPVDADLFPINDSAASNILKKLTWANIKTALNGIYQVAGSYAASGANSDITSLTALTAGGLPNNSVLTSDIADANVTPAKLSQPFTLGTAIATTSGTVQSATGIPSWAKRVTVNLLGVGTNGTSNKMLQLGSGSLKTSGYTQTQSVVASGSTAVGANTTGFTIASSAAADRLDGVFIFTLENASTNTWNCVGTTRVSTAVFTTVGTVSLSGTLDRVGVTSVTPDTLVAGEFSVAYE